jgi:hypothetical protein
MIDFGQSLLYAVRNTNVFSSSNELAFSICLDTDIVAVEHPTLPTDVSAFVIAIGNAKRLLQEETKQY